MDLRGVPNKEPRPTARALNFAKDLAEQLRIEDKYDWNTITAQECSDLIDELKDRLGLK